MNSDTICALATPAGGTISIIRISGSKSIGITNQLFHIKAGKSIIETKGYTLHYGTVSNKNGEIIDDVMVSVYKAPHSYTGEDSIEIACHGSAYVVKEILHCLIDNGCRQAEPGEYTQRAFLNGKMDLSQAEAVADLIASTNRATHQMAISQLRGNFSDELAQLRDQLLHMTSLLELELDFSDHEDLEFADRANLLILAEKIDHRITTLAHSFETGNAIKQGIPVAIVGKTNVGKSTLLNTLLHEDKAIVSDIHGTTRDVIEDTTQINGITFRFIDTAGIRHTSEKIEKLGIERTYQKIEEATIILWILDEAPTDDEQNIMMQKAKGKKLLKVFNKIDVKSSLTTESKELLASESNQLTRDDLPKWPQLFISAKYQMGINNLEQAIYNAANIPEITENDVIVTSVRHYEALTRAHDYIANVIEGLHSSQSADLLAENLKQVLQELGEITGGQISSQETLNNIFKHFCIGK